MYAPQSRRSFLQNVVASTLSLSLGGAAGGCLPFLRGIADRPVRRNLASLAPNDPVIQGYREAVRALKALPATDPRNWARLAQIHKNHCPHGNWYFLPWHRAFLHHFEEICREVTGNEGFALPYWNWTTHPRVPEAFWGGTANPLFNPTRQVKPTDTLDATSVGPETLEEILSQPNFFVFGSSPSDTQAAQTGYGELEATPHNLVHGWVRGDMEDMESPLDPIFWTHHNMVECCWVEWNLHRGNPNTNDPRWTDFVFRNNFVDRHGNPVDVRVSDLLLMPLVSYQYEDCFPSTRVDPARLRDHALRGANVRLEYVERVPLRRSLEVAVGQPVALEVPIRPQRLADALAAQGEHRILLTVGDVTLPRRDEFTVHVFLDRHDVAMPASEHAPNFAGSFSFFVDDEGHAGHAAHRPEFLLDVTSTVRRLFGVPGQTPTSTEHVVVHLVPTAVEGRAVQDGRFRLEFVELAVVRSPRD